MNLEVFLIILGIAILLLIIFCIPVLIRLWRTTKDVAVTLETLNSSLPIILKNLEEITTNINSSTTAVNREVQNISGALGRFQLVMMDIVDEIQNIAPIVRKSSAFRSIKNVVAFTKGIHAFLNVLLAKPAAKV
jgi:uncharacterized protein YoxC